MNEHVYHLNSKTKGLLSVHCLNRNSKVCKVDIELIDGRNNILYRGLDQSRYQMKVKFQTLGDIFIRFLNSDVRLSLFEFQSLIGIRKSLLGFSSRLSVFSVGSGTRSS